jgi:Plavaka transposase
MNHRCSICQRKFSSRSGLTRHANAAHHGRTTLSQASEPSRYQQLDTISRPEYDEGLWNAPITIPTLTTTPDENIKMEEPSEDIEMGGPSENVQEQESIEPQPRYNLRSQAQNIEIGEDIEDSEAEENIEDSETELHPPINLEEFDFDLKDLKGASLENALDTIEGKNKPEHVAEWPSDAYRDFMELIVENNISNKTGDKIIKFFNKYSNLKESPLPKSTKNGKDYLNQINSPLVDFKEKVVATYEEVDFKLHYRPIFHAIQALVQRPKVADNFVCKGVLKSSQDSERIFGEPYESDWWLETEKTLPPLNNLLSIILYSDATTFDGLGKTSGHPVFLTLGNLPNSFRNSPEAKVLLGFLPKIQDSGIKTTDAFRSLQREVYHKCFDIMLRPLLEKPDALYFGIKGQVKIFAPRISFFLSDMLEADEITATYKSSRCKMPCHTCMVPQNNLNNMNLRPEEMPLRTHDYMQQVISEEREKEFSIHSTKNAFWKFL